MNYNKSTILILIIISLSVFVYGATISNTQTIFNDSSSNQNHTFNSTFSNLSYFIINNNSITTSASLNLTGYKIPEVWSNQINLDTGISKNQKIIIDSNNYIHTVWDNGSEVFYQKFYLNGTNVSGKINISKSGKSLNPDFIIDSNNNIHIVYEDSRNDTGDLNREIYYTKLNSSLNIIIDNKQITEQTNSSKYPSLTTDNSNLFLTWSDGKNVGNNNLEIILLKLDNNGNNLTNWINVSLNSSKNSDQSKIIFKNNNLYIIWRDDRYTDHDIFYKIFDNNLNNLTSELNLSIVNPEYSPNFKVDSIGNMYIVWQNAILNSAEIYYAKVDSSGDIIISSTNISNQSGASQNPSIAIDSNNDIHIVWDDNNGTTAREIQYLKLNNTGGVLTSKSYITSNDGNASIIPQIALDSNNNAYVIFQNTTSSNNLEMVYQYDSYPDFTLSIGNNGTTHFDSNGMLNTTTGFSGSTFVDSINYVIDNDCTCTECSLNGIYCTIPINITSSTKGILQLSNLNVQYTYTTNSNLTVTTSSPQNNGSIMQFNATFTNATDGTAITSGTCTLTTQEATPPTMTHIGLGVYQANVTLDVVGANQDFNVMCVDDNYDTATFYGTYTVSSTEISVSGVPELSDYALMLVIGCLIGITVYRKRN